MKLFSRADQSLSVQSNMRRLLVSFAMPAIVILAAILGLLTAYNRHYEGLLHNVTTASEFNQDFKETIDLKMYYYVIESQYSEGLPIGEVEDAQLLARSLLRTTTQKESRLAISSVLDLCENLEEKIFQIETIRSYDERQAQLENNIYVLTALIQEYMYTYLYHEAVYLNTLQTQFSHQIFVEVVLVTVLIIALVLLSTRRSFRLGQSITGPIVNLCDRVEAISTGDLNAHTPVQSEMYEIQTLSVGVEQMVSRLNAQIRENTQKQATLRRTELALLQSQINPHFLYNTMDTIIWLIEADKTQEAVEMVSNLSDFFRHSLSKGRDVISLQEEGRHVCSYLQIQQVRYKDILHYTVNLAPELGEFLIPKLTLQPLVENALYHGIKMKRGLGHIYVVGRAEDGDVVLQVTDDGVGIPPQRLEELRQAMARGERVGFGLSTVHERIRLFFGPGYGLTLTSREGIGTTVTVRIPKRFLQEESTP